MDQVARAVTERDPHPDQETRSEAISPPVDEQRSAREVAPEARSRRWRAKAREGNEQPPAGQKPIEPERLWMGTASGHQDRVGGVCGLPGAIPRDERHLGPRAEVPATSCAKPRSSSTAVTRPEGPTIAPRI